MGRTQTHIHPPEDGFHFTAVPSSYQRGREIKPSTAVWSSISCTRSYRLPITPSSPLFYLSVTPLFLTYLPYALRDLWPLPYVPVFSLNHHRLLPLSSWSDWCSRRWKLRFPLSHQPSFFPPPPPSLLPSVHPTLHQILCKNTPTTTKYYIRNMFYQYFSLSLYIYMTAPQSFRPVF